VWRDERKKEFADGRAATKSCKARTAQQTWASEAPNGCEADDAAETGGAAEASRARFDSEYAGAKAARSEVGSGFELRDAATRVGADCGEPASLLGLADLRSNPLWRLIFEGHRPISRTRILPYRRLGPEEIGAPDDMQEVILGADVLA
jgi:hypothetical protein